MNSSSNLAPATTGERIFSLDVMRGIVLLGILIMSINGMGLAIGMELAMSYDNPAIVGGATGWNMHNGFTNR